MSLKTSQNFKSIEQSSDSDVAFFIMLVNSDIVRVAWRWNIVNAIEAIEYYILRWNSTLKCEGYNNENCVYGFIL